MKGLLGHVVLALPGLLSLILAAPSALIASRSGVQQVSLRVKLDKTTLDTIITILGQNSDLVGEACSTILNSGAFINFPISTNLDQNGAGNITLGTESFLVHEDSELSGGTLVCSRMYNNVESFVNCKALIPASLELSTILNRKACFAATDKLELEKTALAFEEAEARGFVDATPMVKDASPVTQHNKKFEERQTCPWYQGTTMIGNGSPHQNFFYQQLSETINCGASTSCVVGRQSTRSLTVGFFCRCQSEQMDHWRF